jgi:hypothetical protein
VAALGIAAVSLVMAVAVAVLGRRRQS